jgi:hypothetical protein
MELLDRKWFEKFFYFHFLPLCRDDSLDIRVWQSAREYAGA